MRRYTYTVAMPIPVDLMVLADTGSAAYAAMNALAADTFGPTAVYPVSLKSVEDFQVYEAPAAPEGGEPEVKPAPDTVN